MAFTKGQSGNTAGRPKGSTDKRTEYRDMLRPHAPKLLKKAVDMALAGDTTALRICIDRICPAIKASAEPVMVLDIPSDGTLAEKIDAIFQAATTGKIGVDIGLALAGILQRSVDIADATTILQKLEEAERFREGVR